MTQETGGVTNIVLKDPPSSRGFVVGDVVTLNFIAQGAEDNPVIWKFNDLPKGWTTNTDQSPFASAQGEAPVGSSVGGISFTVCASCVGSAPFTNEVHLLAKSFVKEFPAPNYSKQQGVLWADYAVDLGRTFSCDAYDEEWASAAIDTEGLINSDSIEIVSSDGNRSGTRHNLGVDGTTKLNNGTQQVFEPGEEFPVDKAGFTIFLEHPFNLRLVFSDNGSTLNKPNASGRLKQHSVGLIRITVK
jgi:hypothetical protein